MPQARVSFPTGPSELKCPKKGGLFRQDNVSFGPDAPILSSATAGAAEEEAAIEQQNS